MLLLMFICLKTYKKLEFYINNFILVTIYKAILYKAFKYLSSRQSGDTERRPHIAHRRHHSSCYSGFVDVVFPVPPETTAASSQRQQRRSSSPVPATRPAGFLEETAAARLRRVGRTFR